ncbi:MAG: helix-turn-helix domain-containing protein [Lachnospiraceae bacterium]
MSTNRYDLAMQENSGVRNAAKLLYVSAAKYGGDWHSIPHSHACSELFYVTKGKGQFRIEDHIYPVSANDMIIVNPNVEHTEVSLDAHPLEYIVLGVEGLELSVKDNQDNRFSIINLQSIQDNIQFFLQTMLKELESKVPGHEIICQDLMEVLTIHLMRQTNFSTTLTPIQKKASRLCTTVRRYIDEHFKENINLEMLAQMTHVSKYYMVHAFTREYGISPINYMISCRIEEAKQLLKNDDYGLSLISRMLGFSSPSYFSQTFKKATGVTPNEYRKKHRLGNQDV